MNNRDKPLLEIAGLKRSFTQGDAALEVLKGVSLSVHAGEIVGLTGRSGSGKSTLLQMAGLLDQADSGSIRIAGEEVIKGDEEQRTKMRRHSLGFVYQFHHLLPDFTALENVALALRIAGLDDQAGKEQAADMLNRVGLGNRLDHVPAKLSGGEQQRVAVARALAPKPKVLLADEPTGNLDNETTEEVFNALKSVVKAEGVAALIATHDEALANEMDRGVHLHNGLLDTD